MGDRRDGVTGREALGADHVPRRPRGSVRPRRRTRVHANLHHQLDFAPLHAGRLEHLGQETKVGSWRDIGFKVVRCNIDTNA